jgi:predicted dinucleotide-utilizing enzyme
MTLTLNQVLSIILTVAAVVAVTFLAMFLSQLRRTAREGEKTLVKVQEAVEGMQAIEAKLSASLDNVGEVLATTKKAVSGLAEISFYVSSKVIRPSAKYWPLIFPLVRFGLQQMKKRKEKKDVR